MDEDCGGLEVSGMDSASGEGDELPSGRAS